MELRPYQKECKGAVLSAKKEGLWRVLFVQPTGTGKTVTFAHLIREIKKTDRRPALVMAHRDELLSQAQETISRVIPGARIEVEQGTRKASTRADVVIASIPTLARKNTERLAWLASSGASIAIQDECHHSASEGYTRVADYVGAFEKRTFLVGCTATARRLDKKELVGPRGTALFERQVYEYPLIQAIRDKWLCPIRGFRVVTDTNLDAVGTLAGDFNQGLLAEAVDTDARTEKALKHWQEIASARVTLVFCASVEHSIHAAELWRQKGYRAVSVDGSMKMEDRRDIFRRFKSGEVQVLMNCGIATEGFDHPPISCVVMLRPTKSWSLFCQCIGRGTRLSPGKEDLLVIDVVDNTTKHELATLPTVIGLPAVFDMEGKTLEEAHDALEEAQQAGRIRATSKPRSFEDLATNLIAVDLMGDAQVPEEVRKGSRLAWLYALGGYFLDCGRTAGSPGMASQRRAQLTQDALGTWHAKLSYEAVGSPPNVINTYEIGEGDTPDFGRADAVIETAWPDAAQVARLAARWRGDPATEGQLKLLSQWRVDPNLLAVITKGEASQMIARRFAMWGKSYARR